MQSTFVKNITGTAIVVGMTLSSMNFNSSSMVNPIDTNSFYDSVLHSDISRYSSIMNTKNDNLNIYVITESKLVREANLLFGEMREATQEEQLSVHNHVRDISIDTGVNFFDIC